MMRDDPLKNLAVVQAVKEYPQLYERDGTNVTKAVLDQLWAQVGEKVDLPGIVARDRWRIVRGSYLRYLKSVETGEGTRKKYYLAKYLDFLRPFLKYRTSEGYRFVDITSDKLKAEPLDDSREEEMRRTPRKVTTSSSALKKRKLRQQEEEEYEEEQEQVMFQPEEEDEEEEAQEVLIRYEDEERGPGSRQLTYTLRGEELEETTPQTGGGGDASEDLGNPDLMFLKSLLPEMSTLSHRKKAKFKMTVMTALFDLMEDGQ